MIGKFLKMFGEYNLGLLLCSYDVSNIQMLLQNIPVNEWYSSRANWTEI